MSVAKSAFSSDESKMYEKIVSTEVFNIENPYVYFDIEGSVKFIKNGNYINVSLQFPDDLIAYSKFVAVNLELEINRKVFILADTSYGSCCVDEVAAAHVNSDALIHYGHSCLSGTQTLPTYHVFGKCDIAINDFSSKTCDFLSNNKVILIYDVLYYHINNIFDQFISSFNGCISIAHIMIDCGGGMKLEQNDNEFIFLGRMFKLENDLSEYKILFVGSECRTLQNIIMRFSKNQVYSYDPKMLEFRLEDLNVNKTLMKRYYLIQKAKDAQIVGILMGTLGIARYKEMTQRLKKLLKNAGKKYYTFIVGKINVPKLANFMEIDIFVVVACPENSLIDCKEFYKPVVTPYEMEIACLHNRNWTGEYLTDFRDLLQGSPAFVEITECEDLEPEYSFITGKMKTNIHVSEKQTDISSSEVMLRNDKSQLIVQESSNASDFLLSRAWQGLQVNSGDTEIKKVTEGRTGIAMGYGHETDH